MAGSLGGGLIMQSTGKYYWLTFWSNVLLVVGIGALTLSSGIIVSSALFITLGKHLFLFDVALHDAYISF